MNNHTIHCFFADDTAIQAQGSTTKFVIRTLQRGLIEIEKWCTLWLVAINTDKTRSVMFRKGDPRDNLQSLTFFEEELSWDKEVKYLGLILDSKLTNSHIKYNTDKFWANVPSITRCFYLSRFFVLFFLMHRKSRVLLPTFISKSANYAE
ncbi:hypothetical protein AVEN_4209-1 [Araneus ventricosus]|uniref:Uncharacterized protein n=1 Tax=Araneus ventricosus TaxID=182803 RepID=A0A4Y2FDC8_ARAVE|nr:hypothetical protein AVEN_4209-1 [Araneus ventricosus]